MFGSGSVTDQRIATAALAGFVRVCDASRGREVRRARAGLVAPPNPLGVKGLLKQPVGESVPEQGSYPDAAQLPSFSNISVS